jgi:hypothetical protein
LPHEEERFAEAIADDMLALLDHLKAEAWHSLEHGSRAVGHTHDALAVEVAVVIKPSR